jgi:hypothetical protein
MSLKSTLSKTNRANRGLVGPLLPTADPTSGAGGTFAADAVVGSLLVNTTAGRLFICTAAGGGSVTWTLVGSQT